MQLSIRAAAAVAALALVALGAAQVDQQNPQRRRNPNNPRPQRQQQPPAQTGGFRPGGFGAGPQHQAPKPYADVVTSEVKTQQGVFKIHRLHDSVWFEIPTNLLNRDLLMSVQVVKTPGGQAGMSAPGMPVAQSVVRFEKRDDQILMRVPQYDVRTRNDVFLAYGLSQASVEPIIASFDVMAYAPDGAPVIDATRLYNSDPGDFSVAQAVGGSGVDETRSFIERVQDFPNNVEVESQLTFHSAPASGGRFGRGGGGSGSKTSATAWVHYSLLLLPQKPMQPRLKDSRIGYFSTFFTQYDGDKMDSERVGYIDRFRLEKKDPDAAVSDPVKPIVFYIERDVPKKWRSYIKEAVGAWAAPLEKAGFSNAIYAKDAPTANEDPNWRAGDLRYNLISWNPSTTENAEGLHIADPRSGETLHAHVVIWHDVLKLSEDWYFVQASASDPSARKLPLSDELEGSIIRYVVTHEVGHCLGLEHNFKASSAYTVAQLRDKAFTAKYGDEASIMDYGRFNYVAQPGDGARLIPILGPYDYFAIRYGYMPALADTCDGEKAALDKYLARQVTDRTVRFGNSDSNDPGMESEDIGSDPIAASTYGFKNLERVMTYLMPAADVPGDDYTQLAAIYRQVLGQRTLEVNHVARLVGGIYDTDYHAGRGGAVFTPVPKAEQAAAVRFVVNRGLNLEPVYYNRAILDRIQSGGFMDIAGTEQAILLTTLLTETRVQRMLDNEAENGAAAYTVADLVGDVQGGVWRELHADAPVVPLMRRALQLRYLQVMDDRLNGSDASKSEFRSVARADLKNLQERIAAVLPHVRDAATRAHLDTCHDVIKNILDGKVQQVAAANPNLGSFFGLDDPSFCPFEDVRPYIEGVTPAR